MVKSTIMVENGLVLLQIRIGLVNVESGSCGESCVTPSDHETEDGGDPGVEE
jgi:hypothetical protein